MGIQLKVLLLKEKSERWHPLHPDAPSLSFFFKRRRKESSTENHKGATAFATLRLVF